MASPVYLVASVVDQEPTRRRACELYRSPWFRKARAYVTAQGCRWFILSPHHGVVRPGQRIAPYRRSLSDMTAADRKAWREASEAQLSLVIGPRTPVIFVGTSAYRTLLAKWSGKRATALMEGLGHGQQLAWLEAETARLLLRRNQLDLFDWAEYDERSAP